MLDRSIAPAFKIQDKFELHKPDSAYLDNGIPIHIIRSGTQPLLRIELIFKGGTWHEAGNGHSFFTTKMLSEGTKTHTAKEIEEKIAFFGAFLDLETGADRCTIVLYCLSKYLTALLPLLSEIVKCPTFPEEELSNLKKITRQNLEINFNKTNYLASIHFKALMFGKTHPYGRYLTQESIEAIDRSVLIDHYSEYFSSDRCEILVSGNGPEDFYKSINEFLGNSKWGHEKDNLVPAHNMATSKNLFEPKEDSLQSSIRVGLPLFKMSDPDYFSSYIYIEILGGYFGSRLMKNIREDKGYTYGIHANFVTLKNAGYLAIGTDVKKEFTANTIEEIHKEINILNTELVEVEELNSVKNYLLGTFINSINTPFAIADKFKTIHFNSLDYSFYDKYIDSILHINSSQIQEVGKRYFNVDKLSEVVIGGR
ncbi:MAG TPA: pitrilysin family protein [Cytophagaceae bacterium]|jgi:predicted Zn-dependent peptidase